MAFSRSTHGGFGRRRPRGTLLLRGSLLAVVLSCLHLSGTDFVAGFPLPQTARRGIHKVHSLQTSESSSETWEGIEGEETRIYIRELDFGTTEAAIRGHFEKAGPIVEFKARGVVKAQLTYSSAADAKNAVASLNGTTIEGNNRSMLVEMFIDKAKIARARKAEVGEEVKKTKKVKKKSKNVVAWNKENTVCIIGWEKGTAESAIQEHCGKAGSIVDFQVNQGVVLLAYSSSEEAATAVASLNGTIIEGNSRFINVRNYEGPRR
ncbi:unnamed protein product [Polarella glacialis]|uniref:RRM domain-containing protein n=1 Tax=Polarella glacialis TaxID=89957 RepID=A0A813HGB2_POLGL|nr:unnamed protein product [Polarella glacialis]